MKLRAAWLGLLIALPAGADSLRRLAVIVGNDEGGASTRPLLYAREDARKLHEIFLRLGGVHPEDAALVLNGNAEDFLAALAAMERKARDAAQKGQRTALFVYYSGHAKDGALRLGDTRIPFESLKERLAQSPADIRIGIFDSCRSGLLTRTKGARKAPEFAIESDSNRAARGLVILTSSASDEDSQESDQIRGSYFSHHLASGLMGDADRSGDGRVTLSEAYTYAYDRTVADTADSAAGAQHPTFSYDLAGNGDLVLTDFASRTEGLVFLAQAPAGIYYLVDQRGFVVAEVDKQLGFERRIAVPPGVYHLKRRLADRLRIGDITVIGGQLAMVDESRLHDAPFSDDPVKGASTELSTRYSLAVTGGLTNFFFNPPPPNLAIPVGFYKLLPSSGSVGAEFALRNFFRKGWVWGFDLGLGKGNGVDLLGAPFQLSETTVGTSVLVEWPMGNLVPFVGARFAWLLLAWQYAVGDVRTNSTFTPGLVVGARYNLTRNWGLQLQGRAHYALLVGANASAVAYADVSGLVSYDF